jgi:hypothetical protein
VIEQHRIGLAMLRLERERRAYARSLKGVSTTTIEDARKELALFTKSLGEWIDVSTCDDDILIFMFGVWAEARQSSHRK